MKPLVPFSLERWFYMYEFVVDINLCASCAETTNTNQLLAMGKDKREAYLNLPLDYIESNGTAAFRQAVSNQYTSISMEEILAATGASEAISMLMLADVSPGDEIVVQWPIYQSLFALAESLGANIVKWLPDQSFRWHTSDLENIVTDKTKMIIINTPHSPTGFCFSTMQMTEIAHTVDEKKIRLISDEVYRGVFYNDDYPPAAADLMPSGVSIGDLTKPYGLGGLRVGWIASSDKELLTNCAQVRDYTTMCCAAPSEFLAAIALENKERLLRDKIKHAKQNIMQFGQFIENNPDKLEWNIPQGGYTAFPKIKVNMSSYEFCSNFVKEADVLLLPGTVFGYDQHFRIGFGLPPQVFSRGLERFEAFLKNI